MDISSAIEAVGGETNAFTTKEYTCYYARVLDADLPLAIDVMCDLVVDSVLAPSDVETERGVILEEIAMHDDEPGEEVHDLFTGATYGDHPLGRLISGTVETISPMTRRQIQSFYHKRYTPSSIVVAAAGNLDHAAVVRQVKEAFARFTDPAAPLPRRGLSPGPGSAPRPRRGQLVVRDKDTEQAHLVLGAPGLARDDDRRFALGVLNNVARRRHVVPAVPGDPGEAGPGLLGLLVHLAVRRHRAVRRLRGMRAGQGRRGARADPRRAGPGGRRRAHRGGDQPAGRACTRAPSCSASRTPARGCPGWARASCSTTSCSAWTTCSPASTRSPRTRSREVAAEVLGQQMSLAVIGPFAEPRLLGGHGLNGPGVH